MRDVVMGARCPLQLPWHTHFLPVWQQRTQLPLPRATAARHTALPPSVQHNAKIAHGVPYMNTCPMPPHLPSARSWTALDTSGTSPPPSTSSWPASPSLRPAPPLPHRTAPPGPPPSPSSTRPATPTTLPQPLPASCTPVRPHSRHLLYVATHNSRPHNPTRRTPYRAASLS